MPRFINHTDTDMYWVFGESRHAAKELVGAGADSSDERGDEW